MELMILLLLNMTVPMTSHFYRCIKQNGKRSYLLAMGTPSVWSTQLIRQDAMSWLCSLYVWCWILCCSIVQSETAENIQEALEVLKQWNREWCPSYFMMDYSETEMAALQKEFPTTRVFLCDFHMEQAWVRWTRHHKHGLSPVQAEELVDLLRACAWAPPADGTDPGQIIIS